MTRPPSGICIHGEDLAGADAAQPAVGHLVLERSQIRPQATVLVDQALGDGPAP